MAITFNKTDRVVQVSGVNSVSIQELINAIRDYEDSAEGMTTDIVANAYGKQNLGAGMSVGITLELINNWRIQFEAESEWTTKYIIGGNLVAINDYGDDATKPSAYVNTVIATSTAPSIVYPEGFENVLTEEDRTYIVNNLHDIMNMEIQTWEHLVPYLNCFRRF